MQLTLQWENVLSACILLPGDWIRHLAKSANKVITYRKSETKDISSRKLIGQSVVQPAGTLHWPGVRSVCVSPLLPFISDNMSL